MRKAVCIAITVLFFLTVISGIAESRVHPGQSGIHTIMAAFFIVSTLIHIVINRKAFVRYFLGKTITVEKPAPYGNN